MTSVQQQQQIEEEKQQNESNLKVEPHILQRYDLIEVKGKGAYGIVWKARNKENNSIVALKKIFDAFHNSTDSQRTFREVIFLEQLKNHENIIKLQRVVQAKNDKDLYMVFDYMETDLHKVIRANILEPVHKQYIIYQLLKALKYLHSGELIHRDLKPANLLVNAECLIKLADFGLARTMNSNEDDNIPVLTEYVATRWYRAPEILLGSQRYTKAVDMWSIGCILAEMLTNKAIFPGTSTLNQVELIIDLLGNPTDNDIESIQAPLALHVLQTIPIVRKQNFKQAFQGATDETLDFIRRLLIFNPSKRLTVQQALDHPYMKDFVDTEDEPLFPTQIYTLMNDNIKYTTVEYRNALYQHINKKYKEPFQFNLLKTTGSVTNVLTKNNIQVKGSISTNQIKTPNVSGKKSPNISVQKQPSLLPNSPKLMNTSPSQIGNPKQPPNTMTKADNSEPSTTNSDKTKENQKNQNQNLLSKLSKQIDGQLVAPVYQKYKNNQNDQFYDQYKMIQNMVKKQKETLDHYNQDTVAQKVKTPTVLLQNNFMSTTSTKSLVQTNKSANLLRNNSDSFNTKGHQSTKNGVMDKDSFYSVLQFKPRVSTGMQSRTPQVPLSGSLYQLGGRAQLYPSAKVDQPVVKQNRTAVEKQNVTSKHLKSNSFVNKKNYMNYLLQGPGSIQLRKQ